MKVLLFVVAFLFLSACHNTGEKQQKNSTSDPQPAHGKIFYHAGVRDRSVILSNIITHRFSDTSRLDTFKLLVKGTELVNAKVTFDIVDHMGKKIYEEVFDADDLIGLSLDADNVTGPQPTNKQKEDFIKKRIKGFFAEENFKKPAIEQGLTFDSDYSDKAVWNAVESNKNAIGFHYRLGYEDGKSIAYSKRHHKVVIYFECC